MKSERISDCGMHKQTDLVELITIHFLQPSTDPSELRAQYKRRGDGHRYGVLSLGRTSKFSRMSSKASSLGHGASIYYQRRDLGHAFFQRDFFTKFAAIVQHFSAIFYNPKMKRKPNARKERIIFKCSRGAVASPFMRREPVWS